MEIPEEYTDALTDELARYGFEFGSVTEGEDGDTAVVFEADPDAFVHTNPELGIEESYGSAWPPASLRLIVNFDRHGDPIQIEFETVNLLSSASADPGLRDRLNTMTDPLDHAVAVGEALGAALETEQPTDGYLE